MPSELPLDIQLSELVAETGDVEALPGGEYARAGVPFASVTDDESIELRLGPDVADAAMRSPDVHLSERGSDWVRYVPAEWDELAMDRVDAWFRLAWRMAAPRP